MISYSEDLEIIGMKFIIAVVLSIVFVFNDAYALTVEQLKEFKSAINEMCLFPDRKGNVIKAEGEVRAGMPVMVKLLTGELSGKLTYESWEGISMTLDKYKTDPRQCALEMAKTLLPTFEVAPAVSPISQATQFRWEPSGGVSWTYVKISRKNPFKLYVFEPQCELHIKIDEIFIGDGNDSGEINLNIPEYSLTVSALSNFTHEFKSDDNLVQKALDNISNNSSQRASDLRIAIENTEDVRARLIFRKLTEERCDGKYFVEYQSVK